MDTLHRLVTPLFVLAAASPLGCLVLVIDDEATDDARAAMCTEVDAACDPTLLTSTAPIAFTVESVVGDRIIGTNDKGQLLNAKFVADTTFRIAWPQHPDDPYSPTDPYADAARAYNHALLRGIELTDSAAYATYIGAFISGGKARVWIDKRTGTVRAFRPVATF